MNQDALRIETDFVDVHHLSAVGAVPGVAPLLAAAANGPGIGRVQCGISELNPEIFTLAWQAPGSDTFGTPMECPADGTYVLSDGEDFDSWIRVGVYIDYLNPGDQADVFLAERFNNGVAAADVTAAEASAGDVLDYSLAIRNTSAKPATNLRLWLDAACDLNTGISLDGVTYSRPTAAAPLYLAGLAGEASATLYVRRTIAAAAESAARLRVHVHLTFDKL